MTKRLTVHVLWLAVALALPASAADAAPPLPRLRADLSQTTVSGFSSGAYMAGQFGVAYSGIVTGIGLVAGGPYYCTGEPADVPALRNALTRCMNPAFARVTPPDAQLLWTRTQRFAQDGLIDPVGNLARQRVFLFNGQKDRVLTSLVTAQARRFHQLAGVRDIVYVDQVAAGHGMITDRPADNRCDASIGPFFNNCGIPLARQMLGAMYGPLKRPRQVVTGRVVAFSQREFATRETGMSATAYAFVPKACLNGGCRVHVAFHGCWQDKDAVGDHFYRRAGYNETADANRIIVLYPQVDSTTVPYNPAGCWDYWGYSDRQFYAKRGAQLAAVRAMLERLAQRPARRGAVNASSSSSARP